LEPRTNVFAKDKEEKIKSGKRKKAPGRVDKRKKTRFTKKKKTRGKGNKKNEIYQ